MTTPLVRGPFALPAMLRGLPGLFWTLWVGQIVNRLAHFVLPFLGLYLTRDRGVGADTAGLLVSLYGIGSVFGNFAGGWLADRLGRRPTLVAGLVLGGLSALSLGFVTHLAAIAALTFAVGLLGDLYRPALQATVADVVPPQDRVRAYALIYWAVNLGVAIGLSLAGFVAERSYALLFVVDGMTSLAFAGIVLWRIPETRPRPHPGATGDDRRNGSRSTVREFLVPFRDRHLMAFLGTNLLVLLVFFQFQVALPLDMAAHGVSPSTYGTLIALNGLGCILLQAPVIALVIRRDAGRVLALSALFIGSGYALNAVAQTVPVYALGVLVWTIGELIGEPYQGSTVAALAPADRRGRYQGTFTTTWGLAAFLAPALGGLVIRHAGAPTLWAACLGVGILAAVLHLAIGGPRQRRIAELAAQGEAVRAHG